MELRPISDGSRRTLSKRHYRLPQWHYCHADLLNVFLCRSSWRSIMSTGLFDNRLIVLGVMLEIFLAGVINYTWLGHFLLDTAPVPSALWAC